jgi:hypothetical protein
MASTLDVYIDTASGSLLDGGSVIGGALPTLTRNDTYTLRLRLLEKQPNGSLNDIDLSGSSLKAAIGNIEEAPSSGSFKLNINGITSSAIPFNATAISVYTAISNNVSTVALYGSGAYGSYLLTATQPNTAMSFGSDAFTLFPSSSVLVGTRRNPATSIEAQQVVRLVRNPIVYADTFTTSPTSGEIVLTKLQDGSATQNETYELSVGPRVLGGSYALAFGANSTTAIELFTTAVSVQAAISAGINTITSNCSVADNGKLGYIISFTGRFALTNVTTQLTIDSTGVNFIPFKQTTLTINTAEVADAFADSGESTITPTIEIELTQNGTPKTVYQGNVAIRKDLITDGSTVPGAQATYYTKTEADAIFITSTSGGINTTGRALLDSTSVTSLHYGNRTLNDYLGNNALTWANGVQFNSTKLGFYNTAVTIQPASTNVISALVNLGLIANTVTLNEQGGTFPTVALTGSAITVTDNIPFVFGTTSGSKFGTATGQKISFYNSTPIAQPASTNVISALVNLGLIANTVTLNEQGAAFPTVALTGSAITVTDNIPFVLGTTAGNQFGTTTSQKLSFFGSTPIVQPASNNVVSALVNLGLIATSVTLGTPTNVVTDWTGNISATTRFLADSSAVTSIDWGNRVLKNSVGVTAVNWQTGAFGAGPTVVTIAANNVAISGSYYIAMGTENGAFRTLSTLASVTFGAVASNDQHYRDVVVTGAAVNDIVLIGLPSAVSSGAVIQGVAYKANTVCLSCSNSDNGTININTATYRITVLDYA